VKVYSSWAVASREFKEENLSTDIGDPYYLLSHLVMPLREVALKFKSLPAAIQLLALTNTYYFYFQKLDHVKKRYANVFQSYAVALDEHKETIEKEANALLSNSRTDFDYKMRFFRRMRS
jgi:hypothetical protein